MRDVGAPSEAWCILRGATRLSSSKSSPRRVRVSHPPVSSVASVAESRTFRGEQNRRSVHRESRRPQGRPRSLKCWYRSEMSLFRSPRVVTHAEGNTRAPVKGEGVKGRRSYQAVACMKRCIQELGRPNQLLDIDKSYRY